MPRFAAIAIAIVSLLVASPVDAGVDLRPPGLPPDSGFGASVAVAPPFVAVSAPLQKTDGGTGAVHIKCIVERALSRLACEEVLLG